MKIYSPGAYGEKWKNNPIPFNLKIKGGLSYSGLMKKQPAKQSMDGLPKLRRLKAK